MANRARSSFSKPQRPSSEPISKSPPSKNLAHVPCKFFKQGACQAGNSCPFSHQLDNSAETAPCKYFQKGNCKFGAKCALAHILPDGRRVNPKTLAQVYQNHNIVSTTDTQTNGKSSSTSPSSTVPVEIHNGGSNGFFSTSSNNNLPVLSPPNTANLASTSPTSFTGFASRVGSLPTSSFMTEAMSVSPSHPRTFSTAETSTFGTSSIWATSQMETKNSSPNGLYYRSMSHSAVIRPSYQSLQLNNENAILDDDEDDDIDDMFEEDFVPSSLSDLLTPQELQRRGSRSSISRPSISMPLKHDIVWETSQKMNDLEDTTDENEMQFRMDDEEFLQSRRIDMKI